MVDVTEGVGERRGKGWGGREERGDDGGGVGVGGGDRGMGERSRGGGWTSAGKQMVLSEFECDEVENGKGSETSM